MGKIEELYLNRKFINEQINEINNQIGLLMGKRSRFENVLYLVSDTISKLENQ